MQWFAGCVMAVVLACVPAVASAQQLYQSETKAWKFTAPEEWNPIHFRIMKAEDEYTRAKYPNKNYKYIAGFTRGGMNTFTMPYIFVNKTEVDLSGVKYEDMEEGFAIAKPSGKREEALKAFVGQWQMGDTVVDREKNRTVSIAEYKNQRGETVRCTTYSYLGSKYIIQFECYDLASEDDKNLPAIDKLVNSFDFTEEASFVPTQDAGRFAKGNFRGGSSGGSSRYYYGGGAGGIVALGVVLRIALRAWAKD